MEGVSKGRDPKIDSDEENQDHGEKSFERWLDSRIGNDSEVSTLWSALREILMAELKDDSQMAVSLFSLVLKTVKTLFDEHEKLKGELANNKTSAQLKKQMAANNASKGRKGQAALEEASMAIQPKDVAEAMRDHADQLTRASMTRMAAASRLLNFVAMKIPPSTAYNTLSVSAPILTMLLKESQPHTISVPALTTTSILLRHVPPLLAGSISTHLQNLYMVVLRLAITGKPKVRKRAIRSSHLVLAHFQANPNSPAYEQVCKMADSVVKSGFQQASATSTNIMLYTLELLKHTIFNVPTKMQQEWCTACLALPSLCSPLLTQCTFLVFQSLFEAMHKPHHSNSKQQNKEEDEEKDLAADDEEDDEDSGKASSSASSKKASSAKKSTTTDKKEEKPISTATASSATPVTGGLRLDKAQKKLIVSLTNSLFNIQPAALDVGPTEAFCAAIAEAFLCFGLLDDSVTALSQKLPKLFSAVVPILKSGNAKSAHAASECLKKVLKGALSEAFLNADLQHIEREGTPERVQASTLHAIVVQLEQGLQVAYHDAWAEILQIIAALFERLALTTTTSLSRLVNLVDAQQRQVAIHLVIEPIMNRVATLRGETDQSLRKKTEPVLSHALQAIGVQNFLQRIPIGFPNPLTGDLEGQNLWLLTFFREHLSHAEIAFFYNEMLPSTKLLAAFAGQLTKNGREVGAKHLMLMHDQIWAIFPRFCHSPRDLADAFPMIAETIGLTIENAESSSSVRMDLLHGLTSLVTRTQASIEAASKAVETFKEAHPEVGGTMDSDEITEAAEELQLLQDRETLLRTDLEAIQPFCGNYLPLLFNVYVSHITPELRNSVFACVEAFLTISDVDLINSFYTTVLSALLTSAPAAGASSSSEEADEQLHTMQCLTSLSVSFVPYLSTSNLSLLFKTIKPHLRRASLHAKPVDFTLQKKSWKVLRAICEFSSEFAISHLADIQALLAYAEMVGTSKLLVVKAMTQLMNPEQMQAWLQGRDKSFVSKISHPKQSVLTPLPTVVAGWKETSSKTRQAAADTLEAIGHALGADKLIALLVIGLSSDDTHHKAATISCFTLILQRFPKELASLRNGQQLHSLLQTATLLLDLQIPEVRGATLAFIRAAVKPTPVEILQKSLPTLLNKILSWPDTVKEKFMRDIRFLLEKFIKRLEYETVAKAMPKAHLKFLQNINQRLLHAKKVAKQGGKKKQQDGGDSDNEFSDSDGEQQHGENDMQVDSGASKKSAGGKKAHKKDAAWLMEDGGEAPLDFTDPTANRSVVTIDPVVSSRQSRPTSNPFATAEDGRMVITESVYKSSKGGNKRAGIVTDELADDVEDRLIATKKRKRTHEASELADSDDESARRPNGMAGVSGAASSSTGTQKVWYTSKGVNDRPKKAKLDPTASAKTQASTYKAARAGGDTKLAGKADPHAYVKTNPAFLNKRHKNQSVKQYESLIGKKKKR